MVSAHFTIKHHTVEFTHFRSIYCKIIQNHLKIVLMNGIIGFVWFVYRSLLLRSVNVVGCRLVRLVHA